MSFYSPTHLATATATGAHSSSPSSSSSYFTAPAADSFGHFASPSPPPPSFFSPPANSNSNANSRVVERAASPLSSLKRLSNSHQYPQLTPGRSFRDVSSSGDMVVPLLNSAEAGGTSPGAGGGGWGAVGAIGDGRKVSSSSAIGAERKGSLGGDNSSEAGSTSAAAMASLFGGPSNTSLITSALTATRQEAGGGSRPSSFILDVLPQRTDGRSVSASNSPLPSPSDLFGASSSPTNSRMMGLHIDTNQRANHAAARSPSSSTTLEERLAALEGVVQSEVKSLREEVGLLRGMVLSTRMGGGGGAGVGMQRQGSQGPELTLRSPSPPPLPHVIQANGRPTFTSSSSYPTTTTTTTTTNTAAVDDGKDEQIRLLTLQVAALSASVAQLTSSSTSSSATFTRGAGVGATAMGRTDSSQSLTSMSMGNLTSYVPSSSFGGGGMGMGMGMGKSPTRPGAGGGGGGGMAMARTGSLPGFLGSGIGVGAGGGGRGRIGMGLGGDVFDSLSPSLNGGGGGSSQWGGGGDGSPLLGGSGSSAVGSPALGSSQGGAGAGSLSGKWEALGVGQELFRTIAKYGLGPPTKIQAKAIPCVLRNQDIVAQAPSIQERIQSYAVPALQLILSSVASSASPSTTTMTEGIQIIIITATVDQAAQAQRLSVGLGGPLGIRTSLAVGAANQDLTSEIAALASSPPHVLVGTPQRLLDLFSSPALHANEVKLLVIDECDQLIARNLSDFVAQLVRLLPPSTSTSTSTTSTTPNPNSPIIARSPLLGSGVSAFEASPSLSTPVQQSGRQTAILSCTVPQDVLNFASSLVLREPVRVLVRREGGDSTSPTVRGLKQYYIYIAVGGAGGTTNGGKSSRSSREASNTAAATAREWKLEALADLCEDYAFDHCVIFCSSVDAVEAVTYKLGSRAIEALALHQDMGQSSRQAIMNKFRSNSGRGGGGGGATSSKKVLVVYDALCRSLTDVPQVPLVINYDLPRAVEDYVFRITLASASGYARPGIAINIISPGADVEMLRSIEAYYRCKIAELPPNFS